MVVRRTRIVDQLLALIEAANKADKGANEEKIIAYICLEFGCGERLVKESLKHLRLMEKIISVDKDIWMFDIWQDKQREVSHD